MLVAGQRMADEDRVAALAVERAIGLVGDLQEVDAMAGIEQQRLVRTKARDEARRVVGLVQADVAALQCRSLIRDGGHVSRAVRGRLNLLGAHGGTVNVFFAFGARLAYDLAPFFPFTMWRSRR